MPISIWRMALFSVLLVLFGTQFSLASQNRNLELAKKHFAKGQQLVEFGHYSRAKAEFAAAEQCCGGEKRCEAATLFYLGRCFLGLADFGNASTYFDKAEKIFAELNSQADIGTVLHSRGRLYCDLGNYREGFACFDKAEPLLRRGTGGAEMTNLFIDKAISLAHMGRYIEAIRALDEAEKIAPKPPGPRMLGDLANCRGMINGNRQQFAVAEELYAKALGHYRSCGYLPGACSTLINMGHMKESTAEYAAALKHYQEAQILAANAQDQIRESIIVQNIATVKFWQGNYAAAKEGYKKALATADRMGTKLLYCQRVNCLGAVQMAESDYITALASFDKSLKMARDIGASVEQAYSLHNRGKALKELGKFDDSLASSREAIALAQRTGNRRLEATALLRLGNLYEYLGLFEKAIEEYSAAANIQGSIEDWHFASLTLVDIANVRTRMGYLDDAERDILRALAIRDRIAAPKVELLSKAALFYIERYRYVNLHQEHGQLGHPEKADVGRAQECIAKARKEDARASDEDRMLLTYVRGRVLLEHDPNSALEIFGGLGTHATQSGSKRYAFLASVGLGLAYERLGKAREAEGAYSQAVSDAENMRSTLAPDLKGTFLHGEAVLGVKHILPYEGLARVRMQMGNWGASWEVSDYTKARVFSEKMARRFGEFSGTSGRILQQLLRVEEEIAATHDQIRKCFSKSGDPSMVPQLETKDNQMRRNYTKLKDELNRTDPKCFETLFPDSMPLEECKFLTGEWALSYKVTDTGVIVYLLRGTSIVKALFKPLARQKLHKLILTFRDPLSVVSRKTLIDKLKAFDFRACSQLSAVLLEGILSDLPRDVPVIILPDEMLGVIPFEALVLGVEGTIEEVGKVPRTVGATFFGDRNLVSYCQSGSALTWARKWVSAKSPSPRVLAIVDPIFSPEDPRVEVTTGDRKRNPVNRSQSNPAMSVVRLDKKLPRLSLTKQLGAVLTDLFHESSELYEGEKAQKSVLTGKDLDRFSSIVLGTHGYAGDDLPGIQEPIIVFSMLDQPQNSDGFLRMSEVANLKMNPDIVALTACETGLGRNVSGEGIMSMGSAFQYAGARTVVMSLWGVAEKASVDLVCSFFKHLKDGESKIQALKRAREDIRKEGWDHPFFWAAFILQGEPL